MAIEIHDAFRQFIETHRVARLATVNSAGHPSVIPVCYVYDGVAFYSAIDSKPKRVAPGQLQRIRTGNGLRVVCGFAAMLVSLAPAVAEDTAPASTGIAVPSIEELSPRCA